MHVHFNFICQHFNHAWKTVVFTYADVFCIVYKVNVSCNNSVISVLQCSVAANAHCTLCFTLFTTDVHKGLDVYLGQMKTRLLQIFNVYSAALTVAIRMKYGSIKNGYCSMHFLK